MYKSIWTKLFMQKLCNSIVWLETIGRRSHDYFFFFHPRKWKRKTVLNGSITCVRSSPFSYCLLFDWCASTQRVRQMRKKKPSRRIQRRPLWTSHRIANALTKNQTKTKLKWENEIQICSMKKKQKKSKTDVTCHLTHNLYYVCVYMCMSINFIFHMNEFFQYSSRSAKAVLFLFILANFYIYS